ncbi:MAG TPA: molecular chaperone SurA, partial [Gammaproteobacteria bacterium]|nr:molecular chaperone SurA [Gammaproteobacteria bacterium]
MIRILLLLGWASSLFAAPLDRIVAVVDNEVILESELRQEASTLAAQLRQKQIDLPSSNIFIRQVLERLIIKNLQIQYATSLGIRISDSDLNASIENIATKNKLSLAEFRLAIENDGYSFTVFRESIRENMLLNRLRKVKISDKIIISDREIDNFIATQRVQGENETAYRLQHILITLSDAPSPTELQQAQKKLIKIKQGVDDGTNFSLLASTYSDGQNALEGGELGWRKAGELPSLFANVVPLLAISQVSDVIRSDSGFHIVKLVDKKSEEQHIINQTQASHILIKVNDIVSDEIAEKKLTLLKKRIEQGERFVDLARAHSDDMV